MQWARTGSYTLIRTRSANIRVWWVGYQLPPSVFVGNIVSFIGRFSTYNEGKMFRVVDALPFDGNFQEISRPIVKYLIQFCDDPRDWLEKEALDRLNPVDI